MAPNGLLRAPRPNILTLLPCIPFRSLLVAAVVAVTAFGVVTAFRLRLRGLLEHVPPLIMVVGPRCR